MNSSSLQYENQGQSQESNKPAIALDENSKHSWIPRYYSLYSKYKRDDSTKAYSWPNEKLKTAQGKLLKVSFSPCGYNLATLEDDIIKIWNVKDQCEEFTLNGHFDVICCMSYSPDGKFIATGSKDCSVKLWNIQERKVEYTLLKHSDAVTCLAYSPNGKKLVTGSDDHSVIGWNLHSRRVEFTLEDDSLKLTSISYSPDGNFIAIASLDWKIIVWNVELKTIDFTLGDGIMKEYSSVVYSPDGMFITSQTNESNCIIFWSVKRKKKEFLFYGNFCRISSLAFSPDGVLLAAISGTNDIVIWNIYKRQKEFFLYHPLSTCLSFSNNGNHLAAASEQYSIKIWNVFKKTVEFEIGKLFNYSIRVSFSCDSKYLAASTSNKSVKIWNLKQKTNFIIDQDFSSISCLSFSSIGNLVAIGCNNGDLKVFDVEENRQQFTLNNGNFTIIDLSFTPDGNNLALGYSGKTIKFLNVKKQMEVFSFNVDFPISCISCSPNNTHLTIGTKSNNIIILNFKSRTVDFTLNGDCAHVKFISYSSDGTYLASSDELSIGIWNIKQRKKETWKKIHCFYIQCLVFSPLGNVLALGTSQPCIRFWDFIANEDILILDYFGSSPCSFSYSIDARYLAVGYFEGCVKIWDINGQREQCCIDYGRFEKSHFSYSPFLNKLKNHDKVIENTDENKFKHTTENCCEIFTPDKKFCLIGSKNMTLKVHNDQNQYFYLNGTLSCFALCPENFLLAIGHVNGKISIFNLKSMRVEFTICYSFNNQAYELSFAKCGRDLYIYSFEIFKTSIWNKLCYILYKSLIISIRQQYDLADLYEDALVSFNVHNYCNEFYKCINESQDRFCQIISQLVLLYSENNCINLAMNISDYIIKFADIGIEISFLSIKANQIVYFNNQFGQVIENGIDFQILMYLINTVNEIEVQRTIKLKYEQLIVLKNVNFKPNLNPWNNYKIERSLKFETLKHLYFIKENNEMFFNVRYSKSTISMNNVMVKQYIINQNLSEIQKELIKQELEKDAKCHEILNHFYITSNLTCYYYGCFQQENTLSLVTKDNAITLNEFIHKLSQSSIKRRFFLSSKSIVKIIKTLLQSFAFLARVNILHRWICPSSIQIDELFNVSLTDFIFACINLNGKWIQPERILLVNRKHEFISPEEMITDDLNTIDLEKCDVYSFGLVILQLACLLDISDIKNNIEQCLDELDLIGFNWLKSLLKNMLKTNPRDRLSFIELNNNFNSLFKV